MSRGGSGRSYNNNNDDGTKTALIGSGVGALVSGAGGVTVTSCGANDQTFYCKFVRGFNLFKMLFFIIAIIVMVYFLYTMTVKKK